MKMAASGFEKAASYVDMDSAHYWYTKAASLGESASMERLANWYLEGIYFKKDFDKGMAWLGKATVINPGSASLRIANMYHYGDGVKVDKAKAIEYYKLAVKAGLKAAEYPMNELEKELVHTSNR